MNMWFVVVVLEGKIIIMNSKKIIGLIFIIGGVGVFIYGIFIFFFG